MFASGIYDQWMTESLRDANGKLIHENPQQVEELYKFSSLRVNNIQGILIIWFYCISSSIAGFLAEYLHRELALLLIRYQINHGRILQRRKGFQLLQIAALNNKMKQYTAFYH